MTMLEEVTAAQQYELMNSSNERMAEHGYVSVFRVLLLRHAWLRQQPWWQQQQQFRLQQLEKERLQLEKERLQQQIRLQHLE